MSKKRNYNIIDEHTHVGMEVGGPLQMRKRWLTHSNPKEPRYGCMGMRNFLVEAGRWDKKYLDINTIPPYTLDDFIYIMDDAGIEKSILLGRDYQTQFPPYSHTIVSAEYIASLVDQFPDRLVAIGNCNPFEGGKTVAKNIKFWVEEFGIKGVGEMYTPMGMKLDDKENCYPIYEACVEYDIPVFVHIGWSGMGYGGHGYWDGRELQTPAPLDQVAYDFPDLKVVQHAHLPLHYLEITTGQCMRFKNFYTQVGYMARGIERWETPWIRNLGPGKDWTLYCQKYLPDKVMFATDMLWGYPQKMTIAWLESIGLTDEFKKKIFETNVKKCYNL